MNIEFCKISEFEFYKYLEDIKNELKKISKRWGLKVHVQEKRVYYHIWPSDMNQKPGKENEYSFSKAIFAVEDYSKENEGFYVLPNKPYWKK